MGKGSCPALTSHEASVELLECPPVYGVRSAGNVKQAALITRMRATPMAGNAFVLRELTAVVLCAAAGKKKTLNVGRSGGSAGLDDYKFDDALDDDDFM